MFLAIKLRDNSNKTKLSSVVYTFLLQLYLVSQRYQSSYITCVNNLLEEIGMPGFWLNQDVVTCNPTWSKEKVKRCLADNFIQHWYTVVDNEVSFANYII